MRLISNGGCLSIFIRLVANPLLLARVFRRLMDATCQLSRLMARGGLSVDKAVFSNIVAGFWLGS
jgi:hypothetical protein